ncbi:MAG TPA: T9SS type A sorting domain-containing protein, partial [Saprospiraceae bacterium]|nr:T9SS type A sorting domain-containing protein [Saprospiraceae bacterium]
DNCVVELSEYVDSFLNQCGLGYLERVFVVRDNMGRTDTCRQHIEIYDTDPFDENDIIWPYDYHVYSCGGDLDPKNLPDTFGYPIILENDCSLIGISYEDHQFNYVQDTAVCFKILRKWKVIDWCQCYYDARSGQQVCPTWHHEQIIKVSNRLAPKIKDDCPTLNLCLSDQECLKERVTLRHEAEDDCTPDDLLYSSFKIDLYNNGLFDSTYATLGNVITFDGELPVGEHRFLWIFDDQCGNREICTQFVNIRNCKPPTAYCLIGINVNLMPVDTNRDGTPDWGMIDVWANDVDKGSYQFCGNPVTVSFSRDTFDRYRRYDCDSLGQHKVSMWVTDQLTGLQDFCITTITIQDNNNVCPGGGTITAGIAGSLRTPFDQQVNDVTIRLDGPQGVVYKDFNGQYSFNSLLVGADYIVSAVVDKNYMEGISTLDIVKIQRHILGLEPFAMPWHYIAADVTGDHRVTSADVANIRKLILGVDGKYKNNFSWTLMDANYQFPNPNDPWMEALPMQYRISSLAGPMPYLDFVGVKVGDVSQTTWAGFGKIEVRSNATCEWEIGEAGADQRIPVYATQDMILRGMQFTLKYDPLKCNLTRVVPGSIHIQESNLGWGFAQKGYVLVSWNAEEEVHVQAGDLLFYLETDEPSDAGSIDINSDVLNAEAYNAADEILPIQLRANGVRTDAEVVFGEPLPNPFAQATILKLYLKQATEVRYSISDLNGKLIYRQKESYQGGQNVLTIKKDVLTGPGVYLLKVEAGEYTKSMKLVLIAN